MKSNSFTQNSYPMQHPNQEAIQKALDIITEAKSQVDEVLTPVLPTIALGVNSRFNQLTGFLSGVGGLAAGNIAAAPAFPTLAEVAESEGITMRQAVQNVDTAPTNEELERFRARVEALGVGLGEMTDDQILSTVNTPEGEKIIRGAAKQLGFTDFREVPIDIVLIERMRAAAARADEVRAQQDALRNEDVIADSFPADLPSSIGAIKIPTPVVPPVEPSNIADDKAPPASPVVNDALGGTMDSSEVEPAKATGKKK